MDPNAMVDASDVLLWVVGIVFTLNAWWKIRKAKQVLRAAMIMHDTYMGRGTRSS
jgi:hypothetical protein